MAVPSKTFCNDTPIELEMGEDLSEEGLKEGYIPLSLLGDHKVGSPECPLIIPASNDMTYNLTLWSFHDNDKLSNDACFEVGMLGEKKGRQLSPIISCQGEARKKTLLVSSAGPISLFFYNIKSLENIGTFLLQYQGIGRIN